jgi:hypothetical protein
MAEGRTANGKWQVAERQMANSEWEKGMANGK